MVGLRAAEFFAGIGLVRAALHQAGIRVVFANDIEPAKARLYAANYPAHDFRLGDIRLIAGADVPDVDLATASFPCTDLSLAGNRAGLAGSESGMFWEFARVIKEMGHRRPRILLLENVLGFATSHGGRDVYEAIQQLNKLGYSCDILVADARWFVPQSRQRMFIVASLDPASVNGSAIGEVSPIRPAWVAEFAARHPELRLHAAPVVSPLPADVSLGDCMERLPHNDGRWWPAPRVAAFVRSLSFIQRARLDAMTERSSTTFATAYRRTRYGHAVWEIRADDIAGCLRTARGGSSKQAVVQAGRGKFRLRWMTPREYARLQGAPDFNLDEARTNEALFGFGDAVCVPVVAWLAKAYLRPLLTGETFDGETSRDRLSDSDSVPWARREEHSGGDRGLRAL